MRSSEVRYAKLFRMRKKFRKFRAIGIWLQSNAFKTTHSAHSALWLTQARGGGHLPLGLILWNFTTAFLRQPTHVMKYYLLPKYSNMSNKPATRFKHLWFRAHWFCKGIFLNNIVFCACLITFSLKTAVSPPVLEYRIRNTEYRTEYRIQNIEYRI